jgi:hypothetical protein
MILGLLADAVVVVHLAFVAFVLFGGLLALRWPRAAWLHVPAAAWGAIVELAGLPCPLTPLENALRVRAGEVAYGESFVEHWLLPVLYPAELSRELQWLLGGLVIALTAGVYALILRRRRPMS